MGEGEEGAEWRGGGEGCHGVGGWWSGGGMKDVMGLGGGVGGWG